MTLNLVVIDPTSEGVGVTHGAGLATTYQVLALEVSHPGKPLLVWKLTRSLQMVLRLELSRALLLPLPELLSAHTAPWLTRRSWLRRAWASRRCCTSHKLPGPGPHSEWQGYCFPRTPELSPTIWGQA